MGRTKAGTLKRGWFALIGERGSRYRRILVWVVGVLIILALVLLYLWAKRYILYTGDAYIEANWVPVTAEVDGYTTEVFVEDNQWVQRGDPLFQIDP